MRFCDVTNEAIFADNDNDGVDDVKDGFDVVIASLVFDVVALSQDDFRRCLSNVANVVKPGLIFMMKFDTGKLKAKDYY